MNNYTLPILLESVQEILGARVEVCTDSGHGVYMRAQKDHVNLTFYDSFDLHFHHLRALSVLLGTKNINLSYLASEDDLSDVTPGCASEFSIVIEPEIR